METETQKKHSSFEDAPPQDSILYVPYMLGKLSSLVENVETKMYEGFARNDKAQGATNEHLKTLNGKVASHEKRLGDQDAFRESVRGEAKTNAEKAARRVSAGWSILISVITFIVIGIVAYLVFRFFHIDLRSVNF